MGDTQGTINVGVDMGVPLVSSKERPRILLNNLQYSMCRTASPQQRVIRSKMPVVPRLRNPALPHRLPKGAGEYMLYSSKLNNLIGDNDISTQDSSSIKKKKVSNT